MDMSKKNDDFEVCLCYHRTKGEILDFIRNNGIKDLKSLQERLTVGSKCGGCREDLQQLIELAAQ